MKRIVVSIIFVLLLTSCVKAPSEQQDVSLKIMVWNEREFNSKYGNFFIATHPNYKLQVIPVIDHLTAGEDLNKAVEILVLQEKPDVVMLDMNNYELLNDREQLSPLNSYIKKDKFKTNDITPAIIDFFTDEQGQINGLTPTFVGSALYYNVGMFRERGISIPADAMTWDEVFSLSNMFTNAQDAEYPEYGYYDKYVSNPFLMGLYIGEGSGLSFYNHGKFLLQSNSWQNVFKNVTDCMRVEACYKKVENNISQASGLEAAQKLNYPFLEGNIAMAVNDSSLYRLLTAPNSGYSELEWGVVPIPTDRNSPDLGSGVMMTDIFSLTKDGNQEAGWDFIKYVCGPDYARLLPTVNPEELPVIQTSDAEDEDISVFYSLNRVSNTTIRTLRTLPAEVIGKMDEISQHYMSEIIMEKLLVADALGKMESELQLTHDNSIRISK